MISQDWEKFGETIKNTVQDAIDSQDFEKLNQTITNTVNHAADSFAQGVKSAAESWEKSTSYNRNAHESREYRWLPVKLYRRTNGVKVWGNILLGVGGTFGVLSLLGLAGWIMGMAFGAGLSTAGTVIGAILACLTGLNGWLAGLGRSKAGRAERFQNYVREIGGREYCNVKELAEKTGKKTEYIVRDLEYMIRKNWFLQGHMDEGKTCLMVTDRMYRQYTEIKEERMRVYQEDAEEKVQTMASGQSGRKGRENLTPEVRKIVEEGDAYIQKIHECNDAIPGLEISAKISRMELLVNRIFDRVEQNPESAGDIRRLMDYYLPTTVKLLEAYQQLDAQPVDGENIRSSKTEIEATIDTLNTAFEKLLDDMFQDTAWDVSSDIAVLHTMLAQEGLTDDGWKK